MKKSAVRPTAWESVSAAVGLRVGRAILIPLTSIMHRTSTRRLILGVEVSTWTIEEQWASVFFGRIERALQLIARYEPRRLARIRRDVRFIGGTPGGANFYNPQTRSIFLTQPTVFGATPASLAMTIVHEATHGRIAERGVRYSAPMRSRIEAACVRQSAEFAHCLPGGDELGEQEMARLAKPWWTPNQLHAWDMEHARAAELPGWLVRWIDRVGSRRAAREIARHPQSSDTPE